MAGLACLDCCDPEPEPEPDAEPEPEPEPIFWNPCRMSSPEKSDTSTASAPVLKSACSSTNDGQSPSVGMSSSAVANLVGDWRLGDCWNSLEGELRPSKALLGVSMSRRGECSGTRSRGAEVNDFFAEPVSSLRADVDTDRSKRPRLAERLTGDPESTEPMTGNAFSSRPLMSWKMSKSPVCAAKSSNAYRVSSMLKAGLHGRLSSPTPVTRRRGD